MFNFSAGNFSTGIHLDEPLQSERPTNTPVLLTQPTVVENQSCYLYIDMCRLRGYLPSSLELVSDSRTVEMYDRRGDEYLSTVRGMLLNGDNDGVKLYSSVLELPSDAIYDNIALKLLSLRGKTQVMLSKLFVDVCEDHSGSREQTIQESSTTENSFQHHQFLSSLASQNLPPFLKNLVISLQTVSSKDRQSSSGSQTAPPLDLTSMADALRQVHSTISPPVAKTEPESDPVSGEPDLGMGPVPVNDESSSGLQKTTAEVDQDELLNKLEKKLISYIDDKFLQLEQKMDAKFEEIFSRIRTERMNGTCTTHSFSPAQPDIGCMETKICEEDSQLD